MQRVTAACGQDQMSWRHRRTARPTPCRRTWVSCGRAARSCNARARVHVRSEKPTNWTRLFRSFCRPLDASLAKFSPSTVLMVSTVRAWRFLTPDQARDGFSGASRPRRDAPPGRIRSHGRLDAGRRAPVIEPRPRLDRREGTPAEPPTATRRMQSPLGPLSVSGSPRHAVHNSEHGCRACWRRRR